jgi:hypothetical protein
VSSDYLVAWLRDRLEPECERHECDDAVSDRMEELDVSLMDVFFVLRKAARTTRGYDGGCFTVRGTDLDGRQLSVVVAPPSDKNRVRLVRVWLGD